MLRPFAVLLAITLFAGTMPTRANVVISQLFGGGGSATAPYSHDYVQLLNIGTLAINLDGWSVQYASASSGGNTAWLVAPLTDFTLQPGQSYLIQLNGAGGGGIALPTPDAFGPISMSNSSGKVALVNSTIPRIGSIPQDAVDFVGYGSANAWEGAAAAPGISNTLALFRAGLGDTDTGNNAADFFTGAPAPINSAAFTAVPEPASVALFFGGLLGGAIYRRARRSHARKPRFS